MNALMRRVLGSVFRQVPSAELTKVRSFLDVSVTLKTLPPGIFTTTVKY